MQENRLLLLGLLKLQEQHGYQLMDFVDRNLSRITSLKKATVYYELKRLEALGLVAMRQEQSGGHPPRRVYALTPAGEQTFLDLLRENLRAAEPATCGTDVSLMFLDWLEPPEARELIEQKLAALRERLEMQRATPSHGEGSAVDLAISHVATRLDAEIHWFEAHLETLASRPNRGGRKP